MSSFSMNNRGGELPFANRTLAPVAFLRGQFVHRLSNEDKARVVEGMFQPRRFYLEAQLIGDLEPEVAVDVRPFHVDTPAA